MKKIWNRILRFWYFRVKNITKGKAEVGGFKFRFKDYDLIITTVSDNFEMRVRATEYMYGYLVAAYTQKKMEQLHGYAAMMYIMAGNIAKDAKFNRDITRAIEAYREREDVKAKIAANKVSEEDNKEGINVVKANIATARTTRAERRKNKKEVAKTIGKKNGKK